MLILRKHLHLQVYQTLKYPYSCKQLWLFVMWRISTSHDTCLLHFSLIVAMASVGNVHSGIIGKHVVLLCLITTSMLLTFKPLSQASCILGELIGKVSSLGSANNNNRHTKHVSYCNQWTQHKQRTRMWAISIHEIKHMEENKQQTTTAVR